MMIIGIVALLVIGPERLPGAARTAGKYFAKLKRFVTNVRADVEQELRADELREIVAKQQEQLDSLKQAVTDVGKEVNEAVGDVNQDINEAGSDWHEVVADINENGGVKHKQAHDDILSQMNLQDDPETAATPATASAESNKTQADSAASSNDSKPKAETGS